MIEDKFSLIAMGFILLLLCLIVCAIFFLCCKATGRVALRKDGGKYDDDSKYEDMTAPLQDVAAPSATATEQIDVEVNAVE